MSKKIELAKNNDEVTNDDFAFAKENYIYLIIGFGIIVLGFMLMVGGGVSDPNAFYPNNDPSQTPEIFSFRRITLAPIVVLFGFIFEIWAIMKQPKNQTENI
jgi:hypothetical protein